MANISGKPSARSTVKTGKNLYKKGKLSKNARFSPRRIKWTPIIVILCVLASFIFAVILGNILGKKAENSLNQTTITNNSSTLTPPSAEKVSPLKELQAYSVDFANADPNNTLSDQTSEAREKGNALFVNIKNERGEIAYSSEKALGLGFVCTQNLTLARLKNHFEYYKDYAIGFFESDFSGNFDQEDTLKLQTNEILLLKEASDGTFNQIVVDFKDNVTKDNITYYQAYLLNLKLACPKTPIGIALSVQYISNPDNSGSIAGLLNMVDFFVLDLNKSDVDGIKDALSSVVYFTDRYDCTVMLSNSNDSDIASKISLLSDKGITNYIVK